MSARECRRSQRCVPVTWIAIPLLVLAAFGCGARKPTGGSAPPPRASEDWVLVVGVQGGFTGGGSGHRILSDGNVFAWSRLTPEHEITDAYLGTAAKGPMAALEDGLGEDSLKRLEFQRTGNMTAFLDLQRGPERLYFSWPERSPRVKIPAAVQACYEAAGEVVRSVSERP